MNNEMTTLQNIERRITYHIQGAYANVLEVGRCLIEAKESGLVAHGQWEAWVQRVAGMSGRTAQRLMQAAREVSPDSAMAKLPISKIQTILALPEPEREAVAEKAVAESQSLRELQKQVEKLQNDLRLSQKTEARATQRAANAIYETAKARNAAEQARKNADVAITERQAMMTQLEATREKLREVIDAQPATGISAEAQAEIGRLNAALSDAEQMAEYQARQREEAQRELLDLKSQLARGEARREDDLTAEAVAMAVRTLIGAVGYLPHSAQLAGLSDADRQLVLSYAGMLERWVDEVRSALSSDPVLIGEV